MFKGKVLLFSLVLLFATYVYAGDVDECKSEAWVTAPIRVAACPAADFEFIRDTAGHIVAWVKDSSGNGIPGIPWTDWWIQACDYDPGDPQKRLYLCVQPIRSDSMTSSTPGFIGRTTFSGRLAAGGCVTSGGLYLACQGKVLKEETSPGVCPDPICLDIVVVIPDFNADGAITLIDLADYAVAHNTNLGDPNFNPCADWNHDGRVTLVDLSFFAGHYGHDCGY